jgi:hypothetical protein
LRVPLIMVPDKRGAEKKTNAMEAVIPVLKTAARPDHEARRKRGGI